MSGTHAATAPPLGEAGLGPGGSGFVVQLDLFQGPLDLLLDLAQRQKVDLGRISILAMAEQYLAYLDGLRARDLPVAAECLVMAAWLAYLKSQLLLPPAEREEPDPAAVALALEERLRSLAAIRRGAAALAARPRLGVDRLPRGSAGEEVLLRTEVRTAYMARLADLLAAYRDVTRRGSPVRLTVPARRLDTVEAALERLAWMLTGLEWRELAGFLPREFREPGLGRRSAVASSLIAGSSWPGPVRRSCVRRSRSGRSCCAGGGWRDAGS